MDLSTITVILVLTALSLGALVWLEIASRKTKPKAQACAADSECDLEDGDAFISNSRTNKE